mgnify:CR=1 FL=1
MVTGSVKFKNTSCFVKDVFLKIDGSLVIKDGAPVKTAADGSFEIEVPIGKHKISVELNGHTFETGIFPTKDGLIINVESIRMLFLNLDHLVPWKIMEKYFRHCCAI